MNTPVLIGTQVYLSAVDPIRDVPVWAQWAEDTEYMRLLDSDPVLPFALAQTQEYLTANPDNSFDFLIRLTSDDRAIGFVGLGGLNWVVRSAWVGIGIGERDCWGKGYGSQGMHLILAYAFRVLNLNRVNLSVFEYNPRAIRSYEKCGFQHEGRGRESIHREGRRWDMLFMGILRAEWEALHSGEPLNFG